MEESEYKVLLDQKWDLEDLYIFPHTYAQVYYMNYALYPHENEALNNHIYYAFSKYPWQGGYSAVNFYNRLKYMIPKKQRPTIISIQYASPGWIALSLVPVIAYGVAKTVKVITSSVRDVNQTYNEIQRGLSERKLLRLRVEEKEIDLETKRIELEERHQEFIKKSAENMAEMMGFNSIEGIDAKTGSRLKSLKILSSYYRRIRVLTEFQSKGKIKLDDKE